MAGQLVKNLICLPLHTTWKVPHQASTSDTLALLIFKHVKPCVFSTVSVLDKSFCRRKADAWNCTHTFDNKAPAFYEEASIGKCGLHSEFSGGHGRRLSSRSNFRNISKASRHKVAAREEEDEVDSDDDNDAKPTGPSKTVKIYCSKCGDILYKYRKGGKGALVKCFVERIAEDYTNGDMKCSGCGGDFARFRIIKGKPAHKIIGGKVVMRK